MCKFFLRCCFLPFFDGLKVHIFVLIIKKMSLLAGKKTVNGQIPTVGVLRTFFLKKNQFSQKLFVSRTISFCIFAI